MSLEQRFTTLIVQLFISIVTHRTVVGLFVSTVRRRARGRTKHHFFDHSLLFNGLTFKKELDVYSTPTFNYLLFRQATLDFSILDIKVSGNELLNLSNIR